MYLFLNIMLQHRNSVIVGRSIHNQRIEYLWKEETYFQNASASFYFMEDIGLLNHDDLVDLYALHFVFLQVIQQQLDIFREGWAHHSLRS